MIYADAIIAVVVTLFWVGFLSPAIPMFILFGRFATRMRALEKIASHEYVITYNQEMGRLHRVWISSHRPITTHVRGILEGTIVWMPFASLNSVEATFGNSVVIVSAGHRYDMRMEDGRTFFDHFWENKNKSATNNSFGSVQ